MQGPNHINVNDLKKNCNVTLLQEQEMRNVVWKNLNPYFSSRKSLGNVSLKTAIFIGNIRKMPRETAKRVDGTHLRGLRLGTGT